MAEKAKSSGASYGNNRELGLFKVLNKWNAVQVLDWLRLTSKFARCSSLILRLDCILKI